MTQEEKAKAYDEAIERAREAIKNNPDFVRVTPQLMEEIFPELKESEEEMVGMGGLGKAWFEKELLDHIDDVARRLHQMYSLIGHFLTDYNKKTDKVISLLQSAILPIPRETYVPPIIKNPLDPDPNTLGGWETTASTEGGGE